MANSANHQLPGHRGQILCMYAAGGLLFSGGQDRSVRVWNFNAAAGIFMSQSIITKAEGGHEAAVHAFQSYGRCGGLFPALPLSCSSFSRCPHYC
eukprot:364254-Chlamydomonas_euryale.AAC.12